MTTGSRGSRSRTKGKKKTGTGKATRKKVTRKATKKKVARKAAKKKIARKVTKKKVAREVTKKKVARKTAKKKLARKVTKKKLARKAAPKRPAPKKATAVRTAEAERISDLEATIRSLQTSLASIRGEREAALHELDAANARIADLEVNAETSLADTALQSAESSSLLQHGSDPVDVDMLADMEPDGTLIDDEDTFEEAAEAPHPAAMELDFDDYDDSETFLNPSAGISERRRELDRERADRELELGEEDYWFVCPKCGEHLVEHEFDNIKVERCESCGVVTLDKGEIELIMATEDERIIAYRIKGLLQ